MKPRTSLHSATLHNCPIGVDHSRVSGDIVRLPWWVGLEQQQAEVVQKIVTTLE